jgi:hypothetical protein
MGVTFQMEESSDLQWHSMVNENERLTECSWFHMQNLSRALRSNKNGRGTLLGRFCLCMQRKHKYWSGLVSGESRSPSINQ